MLFTADEFMAALLALWGDDVSGTPATHGCVSYAIYPCVPGLDKAHIIHCTVMGIATALHREGVDPRSFTCHVTDQPQISTTAGVTERIVFVELRPLTAPFVSPDHSFIVNLA